MAKRNAVFCLCCQHFSHKERSAWLHVGEPPTSGTLLRCLARTVSAAPSLGSVSTARSVWCHPPTSHGDVHVHRCRAQAPTLLSVTDPLYYHDDDLYRNHPVGVHVCDTCVARHLPTTFSALCSRAVLHRRQLCWHTWCTLWLGSNVFSVGLRVDRAVALALTLLCSNATSMGPSRADSSSLFRTCGARATSGTASRLRVARSQTWCLTDIKYRYLKGCIRDKGKHCCVLLNACRDDKHGAHIWYTIERQ